MIIFKQWIKKQTKGSPVRFSRERFCEGWFLFGFIPLYIKKGKWTNWKF